MPEIRPIKDLMVKPQHVVVLKLKNRQKSAVFEPQKTAKI